MKSVEIPPECHIKGGGVLIPPREGTVGGSAGTLAGHFKWHGSSGTAYFYCHQDVILYSEKPDHKDRVLGRAYIELNKDHDHNGSSRGLSVGCVFHRDPAQALSEMGGVDCS